MHQEHVHGLVDEAFPAVAARIVGELLVDQAHAQRRPQVQVTRLAHVAGRQHLAAWLSARTTGAYDSGEGSKPGRVRWKSSW